MSGASNENEDPLKRTMALIDEHKDKFGDGCYLEIANNLHKAWSERARYFHLPPSAFPTVSGERETRGTSTRREDFDPETGLPVLVPFLSRRRPMTLTGTQPQARGVVPGGVGAPSPPPPPPPPPPPFAVEPYLVKGELFSPEEGRMELEFKCENGFSTGFSSSSAAEEWSTENASAEIGITVTEWVGTLSFVEESGGGQTSVAAVMECTKLRKHDSSRGRYGDISPGELLNLSMDATSQMVSFLSDLQQENDEWTTGACLFVKKMTILDSRFFGLGIPLKMIDMADYMVNDNRSLLVMDPLYLVRDFCNDEMIVPDGTNGEECLDSLVQYYKKIGIHQPWREEKYIGRWNGMPYPSANAVCPHLQAFSLPLLRDIANMN